MSRRDLLTACQRLNIRTEVVSQGKRGSKDNNWLRTEIMTRTYGLNVKFEWKSAAQADKACVTAVDCYLGALGYLLSMAQNCLKHANDELAEYKRLCGLTHRRPSDEARLLRSAGQWYDLAHVAQELHAVETGIKERSTAHGT